MTRPIYFQRIVDALEQLFPPSKGYIYKRGWIPNPLTQAEDLTLNEVLELSTPGSTTFLVVVGGHERPPERNAFLWRLNHLKMLVPDSAGRYLDFEGIVIVGKKCRFYSQHCAQRRRILRNDPRALHARNRRNEYRIVGEMSEIHQILEEFKVLCQKNVFWVAPPGVSPVSQSGLQ
ncbi:uncharacterized protein BO72DRAFT_458298 [Aspergillus fijiensis CBS 313.89]|uniref:Uncharacterized protein n=1 Tax=Aspergillus fijiensis CBS 313.89 TaxID=1448319 RepID=A0A8G1VYH5_9EURO|nr:uncharacterized protein BO72DRAFT_458298 [Aspergillus fijiensis CBS 313.89]RAK77730.1 hypothetical protein BO72DRAFT_458298 [Aspergillus fijiensis CBS 313.89]